MKGCNLNFDSNSEIMVEMVNLSNIIIESGIVIPCFNEGQRLKSLLFHEFLKNHENIFFLFVNDGSTDNTQELLESMADGYSEKIHIIALKSNSGKAEAIRCGINYILKNYEVRSVGYWDADLSTPLSEIPKFTHFLTEHPKILFLMGTRIKRLGANIKRSEIRHYLGRIFATAASIILKLPVYDTQCGAKLIRKELADKIFQEKFISRWLFDIELIARIISNYGYLKAIDCIFELPLNTWIDEGKSRVKITDFFYAPYELLAIRRRYRDALK